MPDDIQNCVPCDTCLKAVDNCPVSGSVLSRLRKLARTGDGAGHDAGNLGHGQHADQVVEAVPVGTRIHDRQVLQGPVTKHRADTLRHPGRVLVLELHSPQRTMRLPHEIKLSTGMCAPGIGVGYAHHADSLLQGEAFP